MDKAYCDALRFAIDYERKGEDWYRGVAKQTSDKFAKKALTFLIAEEIEHTRKIEDFNKSLLGLSEFNMETECENALPKRIARFIDESKRLRKTQAPENLTDLAVYDLAMATEKRGFEMYAVAAKGEADARLKRFFGFLAEEETIHYRLLEMSKKYLEDPAYYFEEAGGWIFG